MVVYNYGPEIENEDGKSIVKVKALDDRVGCLAHIYAIKELSKCEIPAKAVLTSSEEGVPVDVSWGRLVRPLYKKYCDEQDVSIICDGTNGKDLEEFRGKKEQGKHLSSAIVIPYTAGGKGGGDPGIFSVFRDILIPRIKEEYGEPKR
jgi:hypothetical protein